MPSVFAWFSRVLEIGRPIYHLAARLAAATHCDTDDLNLIDSGCFTQFRFFLPSVFCYDTSVVLFCYWFYFSLHRRHRCKIDLFPLLLSAKFIAFSRHRWLVLGGGHRNMVQSIDRMPFCWAASAWRGHPQSDHYWIFSFLSFNWIASKWSMVSFWMSERNFPKEVAQIFVVIFAHKLYRKCRIFPSEFFTRFLFCFCSNYRAQWWWCTDSITAQPTPISCSICSVCTATLSG